MKSTRLRIAANLVLFISLFAALIGCGLYALFCLPAMLNLPFRWEYLAITGIGFVVCAIIALILAGASRSAAKKEEEEARLLEAALVAEAEALAAAEKEAEEALCEEKTAKKIKLPKAIRRIQACAKPTAAAAIEVGKIALPVVAACTVTAMVIKAKHRKQKEKNRQAFYRWLG